MIKLKGDGGHTKVVRSIIDARTFLAEPDLPVQWFIAVGDNASRKREAEGMKGYNFAKLIHPTAVCYPEIGEGSIIMAGAIVQPGAKIGKHVIVNTGATVDHDCIVEDFAHIAPGAHLCGGVHVGEGALVGVGVGVAPGARIPAWTLCKARRLEFEPLRSD